MPNSRPNLRWLPYCNSFLLGATAAFCYSQLRHRSSPPETLLVLPPRPRLLATARAMPAASATPQSTIKVPAPQVLKTPPLVAGKAPQDPKAPQPGAIDTSAFPNQKRVARAPIDLGSTPPSTSTDTSAPDTSSFLLPEPQQAPARKASAKARAKAPEKVAAPAPSTTRLAAAAPAQPPRRAQSGGSQAGGDESHSESSASAVAAAVTRPEAPVIPPATPTDPQAASGGATSAPSASAGVSASTSSSGTATDAGAAPEAPASTYKPSPGAAPAPASTSEEDAATSGAATSLSSGAASSTSSAPASATADTSLEPSGGSTLPERAEQGISSRTQTSNTNALSPAPPEASLPLPSVNAPLASINASTINGAVVDQGITRLGSEPLLAPIGVAAAGIGAAGVAAAGMAAAGSSVASGTEDSSPEFGLTSDTPALFDTERGITIAQGRVTLSYGTFTATGKRGVIYNKATPRIAQLSDDLTIVARVNGREQTFTGQSLTFNLDTGRWDLTDIRATFPPDLFPRGQVLEPLFLRDGRVFGTDQDAGGSNFRFSSCDKDHYYLSTRQVNFYRDEAGRPDRIVLKHNALYVLGHKIIELPTYVYSLQGQRSRRLGLQPQVGQNDIDGFFAKTIVDLGASSRRTDSLLVDALQKRGLGLGLQRELAGGAGLFYLYAVSGGATGREVDARVNRNFNIGKAINSVVSYESTTNNSLTGAGYSNSTGSLNLNYAPTAGNASGSVQLSLNNTKNPFSTYSQRQGTLDFTRQLGADWDVSLNTQYNSTLSRDSSTTGETSQDKQEILDNSLGLNRHASRFDSALLIETHDDLTGRTQRNGAYSLERLPQLELTSDSQRLGLGALDRVLPGSVGLSLGTYNEPATLQRLTRTRFEYLPRGRQVSLVDSRSLRSHFDLGGAFHQNAYSDNTARYDYEASVGFTTEVGRLKEDADGSQFSALRFEATYQKLKPTGYTPFQFDFLSPNEVVSARGIFQPSRRARLELEGGRDLQNGITRDLGATLRLLPTRALSLDVRTTYSLEQKQLNDVLADVRITRPRNRFLGGEVTIGTRYTPEQSVFSTINVGADVSLDAKTRFQAFTSYNGFSKKFDVQQFRIQRDLHCFNLFASYDGQRKQFRFDLALKAFPFVDSRLGQSILGEGFDPALGAVR